MTGHRLVASLSLMLMACGVATHSKGPNPAAQRELEAAKSELAQLQTELAELKKGQPSVEVNPESLSSAYQLGIHAEHFAQYVNDGQAYAKRARAIEGVELYVLLVHPTLPNTVIWVERYRDKAALERYKIESRVAEVSPKYQHMIKMGGYVLVEAREAEK